MIISISFAVDIVTSYFNPYLFFLRGDVAVANAHKYHLFSLRGDVPLAAAHKYYLFSLWVIKL